MKIEINMQKPDACCHCPFYRVDEYFDGRCVILDINDDGCNIPDPEFDVLEECPFNQEEDE